MLGGGGALRSAHTVRLVAHLHRVLRREVDFSTYKPEEGGKPQIAGMLGLDILQKSSLVLFKRPSLSRLWAQQDIPDTFRV